MIFLDILSLLHKQRAGKDMQERDEIWNGIKSVYIRVVSGKCMRMHQHSNYSLPFSLDIFLVMTQEQRKFEQYLFEF